MLRSDDSSTRIGYVLKMYPRFSETFIVNEILAHEAAGHELHVFSLRPPIDGRFHATLAEVRAEVIYIDHKGLKPTTLWRLLGTAANRFEGFAGALPELLEADVGDAAQALEIADVVDREGITHLHAHFGSVATTVARLVSLVTGVSYTFTAHAKDIFHEEVDPEDLRVKLADASACVTVSDFNVRHLRGVRGSGAGDVVRIYNGLQLDRFTFEDPADRPATVIGVGRLVEKKGFADLVGAMTVLRDAGKDITCRIVGTGPLEDELRRQVAEAELADVVTFTGALPQQRVIELVASSCVLAAPCVVGRDGNRDGMPTVLLEAMALGTPCVATPVTGVPELITHDEHGLLVDEHDPDALASSIERLVDDTALRSRLAGAARRAIETDFDIDRQSERLRNVFEAASMRRDLPEAI